MERNIKNRMLLDDELFRELFIVTEQLLRNNVRQAEVNTIFSFILLMPEKIFSSIEESKSVNDNTKKLVVDFIQEEMLNYLDNNNNNI